MRKITALLFAVTALAATAGPAAADTDATYSTLDYGTGKMLTCTTDYQDGTFGAYNAWGDYIDGCTVEVKCPDGSGVCTARENSGIFTLDYIGHRVTLNSRMRVFSRSGSEFWHRDVSCDNTDWCIAEDMVKIREGESASVQCNGVREHSFDNQAFVQCQLDVEYRD
jgi:hypothetical protein